MQPRRRGKTGDTRELALFCKTQHFRAGNGARGSFSLAVRPQIESNCITRSPGTTKVPVSYEYRLQKWQHRVYYGAQEKGEPFLTISDVLEILSTPETLKGHSYRLRRKRPYTTSLEGTLLAIVVPIWDSWTGNFYSARHRIPPSIT